MSRSRNRLSGGGGSGGSADWYWPTFATAPDVDPAAQVVSATAPSPGRLDVVTANENVATYAPFAGPTWVAPIKGLDGLDVETIAGDLLRTYAKPDSARVDLVIWAGFRNSVNGHGFAAGVAWLAASSAYETVRSVNTGAGWSAPADGVGVSALTVAALGCADPGASGGTTLSSTSVALDATGNPISLTNQAVTRSAANLTGPFDEVFLGMGFRTGTGGAAGATVGLGAAFAALAVPGKADPFA